MRVSHDGGAEPVWTGDGGTLYYLNGRSMMAVAVETSTGFEFAAPVRAFDGDFRIYERPPSYDVTADGRFVTTRSDTDPSISFWCWFARTGRTRTFSRRAAPRGRSNGRVRRPATSCRSPTAACGSGSSARWARRLALATGDVQPADVPVAFNELQQLRCGQLVRWTAPPDVARLASILAPVGYTQVDLQRDCKPLHIGPQEARAQPLFAAPPFQSMPWLRYPSRVWRCDPAYTGTGRRTRNTSPLVTSTHLVSPTPRPAQGFQILQVSRRYWQQIRALNRDTIGLDPIKWHLSTV